MNIREYNKLRYYIADEQSMDLSEVISIGTYAGESGGYILYRNGTKIEYRYLGNIHKHYQRYLAYIINNPGED